MALNVTRRFVGSLEANRRISTICRHLCSSYSMENSTKSNPTVGIIIIGDEILKGHVQDTNSHFLCRRLFSLGVKVQKISVIPDDLDTIAQEVAMFSSTYTHVLTSGGIGPTHDDMTFEGVARAFDETTHTHPVLLEVVKNFWGENNVDSAKLKLAQIPQSAKLQYFVDKATGEKSKYPLVCVNNVFIFPGIPKLMERAFTNLEHIFMNPNATFHLREMYITKDEVSITPILNQVNEKFKGYITLGSYPDLYNSYYKVKLTLESQDKAQVNAAWDFLKENLPEGSVIEYEKNPIGTALNHVYSIVDSKEDTPFKTQVTSTVKTIEECLQRYKSEEICVGFNGGKDCTLLLHTVHAVLNKKFPIQTAKLKSLYIRRGQPFPEVELFIKKSVENYRLDPIVISGRIKEAMTELKTTHPEIKAVIMGTRRTDPYSSHLENFSMTDSDWPQFMRVNPILDWSYGDVWHFIRSLNVPYCSLYDRGYTSLGSMENTHPNPKLQTIDDKGSVTYIPAYQLKDSESERAGRN